MSEHRQLLNPKQNRVQTIDVAFTSSTNILIFDGDCGFCTTTANFIVKRSTTPIVSHAWQLTDVSRFGLTEAEVSKRVYFITGGHAFGGHQAFAQILWTQRNPVIKAVGLILTVPPFCWLGNLGYWLIARYRHRLPGGTPACAVRPAAK